MEPYQIAAMAQKMGINLTTFDITDYAPQSDGLSGGVSWLYSLRGKIISCQWAGIAHDCLYARGGTKQDRKKADRLLFYCAALSGMFIPGWLERLYQRNSNWLALLWLMPVLRIGWRFARAWLFYQAVRWFAGGPKHWAGREEENPIRDLIRD